MNEVREQIRSELAEFLYGGVSEFSGIENGNFPLADKILALPKLKSTIEKAEKYKEHDSHKAYIYDEIVKQIGCIFNPIEIKEWKEGKEKWDKYKDMSCSLLMQEEKKKALKYDKFFRGLMVVEECPSIKWHGRTAHFSDCPYCNGTGKIYRELTEAEKEEIFEYIVERERGIIIGSYLDSSGFKMQIVEIKK